MKVSVNWLAENLQMHGATVRKRISDLERDKRGRVNLRAACEAIFGTKTGTNGEFISTPEANRQLILAKKKMIELQNAKFQEEYYPRDFVHFTVRHAVAIVVQTLKANCNRQLTFESVNDILKQFREAFAHMREDSDTLEREYEQEKEEKAQAANGSDLAQSAPENQSPRRC